VKKIEATIRPFKLHEVRAALEEMQLQMGEAIFGPAAELGHGSGVAEIFGGTTHVFEGRSVVKVEVVVQDRSVARVRDAIAAAARTGRIGDGRLVITRVDEHRPGSVSIGAERPEGFRKSP